MADTTDVLNALKPILGDDVFTSIDTEVKAVQHQSPQLGSYDAIKTAVSNLVAQGKIDGQLNDRLSLALEIAEISNNNQEIIKAVDEKTNVNSLREFAVQFDTAALQKTLSSDNRAPAEDAAAAIRAATFKTAPTAAIQGMVMNDKVALTSSDPHVKADVVDVLSKLDIKALGSAPVSSLPTASPDAFSAVPVERIPAVTHELKTLSRVASIAPTTTAMQGLFKQGLTTSLAIAKAPKENFVAAVAGIMPADTASEVHGNAVNTVIRNENALVGLLQLVKGTGLQVLDGKESPAFRQLKVQELAAAQSYDLNIESLFGSMDQCVCEDCTTVYSAASYFVDMLEYLRKSPRYREGLAFDTSLAGQQPSIKGTVLETLFKRRPDLGNLQLTCENTNAVLPYIDLANEVMESFIMNLDSLAAGTGNMRTRQVDIDVYNVGDEDSSDLLAQPQNTNYSAYQILAAASYPLTLPYHQPIDAQRAFLEFLKVPRSELVDAFRQKPPPIKPGVYGKLTDDQSAALRTRLAGLQNNVMGRQLDAEMLGLVQEEYLILTGEVFFESDYFAVAENISLTLSEYQSRVGLLPPYKYWGYSSEAEIYSTDETARTGLQFVKRQFLPRSGVSYSDLVAMVETSFINPRQPQGRAKTIFDELQFSYRFLQTLVDDEAKDSKRRYGKLAEFLVQTTNVIHLANLLSDDASGISTSKTSSSKGGKPNCVADDEVRNWVFKNFESLGKVIVLDSGEGPRLPVVGDVYAGETQLGTLSNDGTIKDANGTTVANVDIGGRVMMGSAVDDVTMNDKYKDVPVQVRHKGSPTPVGVIQGGYLEIPGPDSTFNTVEWGLTAGLGGSCNIDNVRLTHLDGTSLDEDEWNRCQKFIRLWTRLGWSVSDINMALMALNGPTVTPADPGSKYSCGCQTNGTSTLANGNDAPITFDNFTHTQDAMTNGTSTTSTTARTALIPTIGVETIHQLAAIKKLLPLTGLPVEQLLTFWTSIPTRGSRSLYSRLFFGSNVRKTDAIFGPDANGDYFTGRRCKISDNLLVILAAFGMKASDVSYLLGTGISSAIKLKTPVPDVLSIDNLSMIYRYGLIAKILGVGVPDMGQILTGGFPDPFQTPSDCLDLLQTWNKMTEVGWSWPDLRYVADDIPSDLDPLAPSTTTVLQTAKTLHDGIIAIQEEHTVPKDSDPVTADMVQAKVALIFDEKVVTEILQLLNGKSVYLTSAPTVPNPVALNQQLAVASNSKATYLASKNDEDSQLQVTGILTKDEVENADAAAEELYKAWTATVTRSCRQPRNVFYDDLVGIFPTSLTDAELSGSSQVLLAPDVTDEDIQKKPALKSQGKTTAQKCRYFLQNFIPFLQEKLARVLVEDTITSAVGFNDRTLAQTMLENIAIDRTKSDMTAMDVLLDELKQPDTDEAGNWSGYLAPLTSDSYVFAVSRRDAPPPFVLNGQLMAFKLQQEDPKHLWSTSATPVKLNAGTLYPLQLAGIKPEDVQWKPATGSRTSIPSSSFLPNQAEVQLKGVFMCLQKLAIIVNDFKLSSAEVVYIYSHQADFEQIDFVHLSVKQWKRLQQYVEFRNSLPAKTDMTLLELFNWAVNNKDADKDTLAAKISEATTWNTVQIGQILDHLSFEHLTSGKASNFTNEQNLSKFTQLIALSNKLGVDIPRLFTWATPVGTAPADFFKLHDIAEDIQKTARSRYNLKTWPDAVKPANDILRENQKQALISYLLVQDEILALDIHDADGLFEYFLIDTQMTPLVETSRIKQAIATVQVYVQRCLLGLEEPYGVPGTALDRQRWDWMQKYRVWEANRKVFLYPENWIDPSLRDDKSDFFKELENELLQKDLNRDVVSAALKSFLYNVSEVSNLSVVGLCVDYTDPANTIHLFARTRTAAYSFYHNTYASSRWSDWKKMAIEVPYYSVGDANDASSAGSGASGVYFAPIAYNNRIVVFIPQIMRKTIAPEIKDSSFTQIGNDVNSTKARLAWEIKLSWTEFRNGAWTPRKLCPDSIVDAATPLTPIDAYSIVPTEVVSVETGDGTWVTPSMIKILVANTASGVLGEWHFQNGQLSFASGPGTTIGQPLANPSFGYFGSNSGPTMYSLQAFQNIHTHLPRFGRAPSSVDANPAGGSWGSTVTLVDGGPSMKMYHTRINDLMSASMAVGAPGSIRDLGLFGYMGSLSDADDMTALYGASDPASDGTMTFDEMSKPFSLYTWELGLHAPMMLIDRLLKAQQFDQALEACQYVFDPMAKGDPTDMTRFWVFAPFRSIKGQTIEAYFQSFKAGEARTDVTDWRNNPFAPHVIARGRPIAYMKWIVMKYIEILIAYGDYYFRQNTLETIPNAIQMYILASHLYGPRGQKIKREGKVKAYTYNSLMTKFDAFSNAMVQMEEIFPFSNQTPLVVGKLPDDPEVQMANVFGFAGTLYFTIPDNPNLRALGDTIDDRLFKIRHSQDINGVFRQLPLFEPPIDPGLLVAATAQGLSLSSVLSDLNGPMPNYRFQFLLSRALELAQEVKAFGQALLSAREKQDNEAYAVLKASHETASLNLVMEMKKFALDEANSNLEALQYSRNGPLNRMRYYLKLAGEDPSAAPALGDEFNELDEKVETPLDVGGLRQLAAEKLETDLHIAASALTIAIPVMEGIASVFKVAPSMGAHATPLGCGAVMNWGPPNAGAGVEHIAKGLAYSSEVLSFASGMAGRKAAGQRALSERLQAANAAGYEISSIDKQIAAGRIRQAMAARDIDIQQAQIDQAREAEDFLRSKYTNAELYSWVSGQTKTLYYQTYTQAYDLAKKVEKAFRFERPQLTGAQGGYYIQAGYWNASKDGLLAGESLYYALKQLEAAYIADRGYDFEVVKNVSLRQVDPMQLIYLRETGACEFAVPEVLYDMDFPGHYMRRIKAVSVTVPCVIGPYSSVNATLRLTSNKYRVNPSLSGGYPETGGPGAGDDRFATTNVPISAIAVSTGQSDPGVFELSFTSDRYMPFEGAGAASAWRLELPQGGVRSFDYGSIADVILTIRYTSLDGGEQLKAGAAKQVQEYVKTVDQASGAGGLFALFDVRNEFATSWARFMQTGKELEMKGLDERLPLFAVGRQKGSVLAQDIYVVSDGRLPGGGGQVGVVVQDGKAGSNSATLVKKEGDFGGELNAYVKENAGIPLESWTLQMDGTEESVAGVKRLWMLVRYILK
ncbi:hypothetical protein QBC46DRAFT_319727 [Diplogelasinospora grovesii]|uniref:Toxin subunit n=1 Tax=Diplogelasinospora grovesii TaxID=303347 RepID=A0AAN6S1W1_9PEZI|nr:hypothetical protein QBC46DRAFT_319727 [Diplogelasinospora grovesii]